MFICFLYPFSLGLSRKEYSIHYSMKPYLSDSCSYLCYEQVNAVFVVFSNQFRLKNGFGVLQMLQQRNTEESKKDKRNDVSLFHNPLRRTKSRHHPFRGTLP